MDEPKVIIDLPQPPVVELSPDELVDAGLTQPLKIHPPNGLLRGPDPRMILAGVRGPLTQAGPYPSIAPATVDVDPDPVSWRPPPRMNTLPIVLGVMGVCGTLAAIAGVIGVHRWHEKQREDVEYAQRVADEDRRHQAAQTIDPTAGIDPSPIATVDPIPTIDLSAPPPKATKPALTAPAVQPKTTNAAPVVKSAPGKGTGTLRTYSSAAGKAVFVDGKQAGVAPAPITVQCGTHQIRVGEGKTRSVNVPCFGAITVGTPDGD